MKSPAILSTIKDEITNKYSTIITNEQESILPPCLANFLTGYKSFFNEYNDSTYN